MTINLQQSSEEIENVPLVQKNVRFEGLGSMSISQSHWSQDYGSAYRNPHLKSYVAEEDERDEIDSVNNEVSPLKACTEFLGEMCGLVPDNIVVKVLSFVKPYEAAAEFQIEGMHELIPVEGAPYIIIVGQVTSHPAPYCHISYGDRILALLPEKNYSTTYVKIPYDRVIKVKKNLAPWQQISIALTYFPAFQALKCVPFTLTEQRVLICSGLGPMNEALIRLCVESNAEVVYVPCEDKYAKTVRKLGAEPIEAHHTEWGPMLINSIDVVFDSIGENKFITSKAMVVKDGHMVVTGHKILNNEFGSFWYGWHKREIDFRLKNSARISNYNFMESFESNRQEFERDFNNIDRMIFEWNLPIIGHEVKFQKDQQISNLVTMGKRHVMSGYGVTTISQDSC